MITKHEALETLDRLEFFNGQRAGRELWFEKNSNLQDIDIACFVRDISNLREYIQTADVSHKENDMTKIENHCCDCSAPGYPCRGALCPDRHVTVLYCDNTRCVAHHTGAERLFLVGGVELCEDCVAAIAERNGVEVDDIIEGEV